MLLLLFLFTRRVTDILEMTYSKTRLQYCVITDGYLDVLWTNILETVLYITRLYYFIFFIFFTVADDRLRWTRLICCFLA